MIEARDFLQAIHAGQSVWPTFEDGMRVNQVVDAAFRSQEKQSWVSVEDS